MSYIKTDIHPAGHRGGEGEKKLTLGEVRSEGASNSTKNKTTKAHGSGATTNGRYNYPEAFPGDVHKIGHEGAHRESKPKAHQVSSMGAHDPGTGRKHEPGENGNGTVKGGDDTQPDSKGSSTEEQRARLARRMYPSSSGTRREQKAGV